MTTPKDAAAIVSRAAAAEGGTKATLAGQGDNGVASAVLTPAQVLAQFGVIVMPNLNDIYELTGANVIFGKDAGIEVTIFNKAGLPAVGAPVVVNIRGDGKGDDPQTPNGSGSVQFLFGAASAYTPPQRGPFTVTLVDTASVDDQHYIRTGVNLSPSIQGMGDYTGQHTTWQLQFRESGGVVPPSDLPIVDSPDDLRNLANNVRGIPFLASAALVQAARAMNFGVPMTPEARYVDSAGVKYAWQAFSGGILYCVEGQWDKIKVVVW